MLFIHIIAASFALIAGFTLLTLSKGTSTHRKLGKIFVTGLLISAASSLYLYYARSELPLPAILCIYLLITSWLTIKRPPNTVSKIDWGLTGLILIVSIGLFILAYGVQIKSIDGFGVPAAVYYIFASIAGFSAIFDFNMILKGGLEGNRRLARHIWRMMTAFVLAMMAVAAQKRIYPEWMIETKIMIAPLLLLLVLLIYWVIKTLLTKPNRIEAT